MAPNTQDILQPAPLPGTMDTPEPATSVAPAIENFMIQERRKPLADPEGPFAFMVKAANEDHNKKAKLQYAQEQQQELERASGVEPQESQESPMEPDPDMPGFMRLKLDATPEEIRSFYADTPQVAEAILNPSVEGLIPTTSPLEMAIPGGVVAGRLGGLAGLAMFTATSPIEMGAMLVGEEVGEDNWLVGMGIEVAFGVGAGILGEKVFQKGMSTLAKNVDMGNVLQRDAALEGVAQRATYDYAAALNESIDNSTEAILARTIAPPQELGGIPVSYRSMNIEPIAAEITPQGALPVSRQIGLPDVEIPSVPVPTSVDRIPDVRYAATTIQPNWVARARVNTAAQLRKDVQQGDLRNPEVRQVYKATLDDIPEQSLTPDQAAQVEVVKTKIGQVEVTPPKQKAELDIPVADKGASAIPARVQRALHTQISQSWYGKPVEEMNIEARVASIAKQSMEAGKPRSPQEIRKTLTAIGKTKAIETLRKRLVHAGADPAGAEKLYNKKKALGQYGELFQDDLRATTQFEMARLKKLGENPNYFDTLTKVEKQLIQVYKNGINSEVKLKASTVNYDSFLGQKGSYVKGGMEDPDPRFPTPQGGISKTPTGYGYDDWDIIDHMEVLPDSNTILFNPGGKTPTPGKPNNNKAKLTDYSTVGDSKELTSRMTRWIQQGLTTKVGIEKVGGFNTYTPAEKLKVPFTYFDSATGKPKTFNVLPEDELEAIAKMFGWGPGKVQPSGTKVGNRPMPKGKPFVMTAEDIVTNRDLKLDWDKTNPDYFKNAENRAFEKASPEDTALLAKQDKDNPVDSPRARMLTSAAKEYGYQRLAYVTDAIKNRPGLRELFNQRVARSTSAIQGNKENNAVNYILDRIAVMRNTLADDIRWTENSPDARNTKKAYMMFQDLLSGSDTYYAANRITRGRTRDIARAEVDAYGSTALNPADVEARIVAIADRENLSLEDATTKYYEDLLGQKVDEEDMLRESDIDETEEGIMRLMAGEDGTPPMNRANAEAEFMQRQTDQAQLDEDVATAQRQQAEDAGEDFDPAAAGRASDELGTGAQIEQGPTTRVKPTRGVNLASAERLLASDQFSRIEDRFGIRFADDLYSPSVANAEGRINILRVNSTTDLTAIIQAFDNPVPSSFGVNGSIADVLLDDLDPMEMVGVGAYNGHSQDAVNRLTSIISDLQGQTGEAAQILTRHPNDPLSALAFEKLETLEGIFTTQLANGTPNANSMAKLESLNFSGDDMTSVQRVIDATKNAYPIRVQGTEVIVDTRVPLMKANMYMDMETSAQRGEFMRAMAATSEEFGEAANNLKTMKARETLSRALRDACGPKG